MHHKPLPVTSVLFLLLSIILIYQTSSAQSFYKEYSHHLLNRKLTNINTKASQIVKAHIRLLQSALNRFEETNGHSILNADTVYLVLYESFETGWTRELIWNPVESCSYEYRLPILMWDATKFTVVTNASNELKELRRDFRHLVETADTSGYRAYAKQHGVFDGESVSFIRAARTASHWNFITSGSYAVVTEEIGALRAR